MNKEKGRVVYPAASFQPPDSCPECLAGVPFNELGQHAQAAETPWEDLRARALQDYEDKATATHSWSSVIPRAINFYFDNFHRLSTPPNTQDTASPKASNHSEVAVERSVPHESESSERTQRSGVEGEL